MNEVLVNRASQLLGGPLAKPAGVSERRRQPQPVVERRLSDGDERRCRRGDHRPVDPRARDRDRRSPGRPGRSPRSSRSPHPPSGRDSAHPRPGDLRLGRPARARPGARARCAAAPVRLALGAPRSALASMRRRTSAPGSRPSWRRAPARLSSRRRTSSRRSPRMTRSSSPTALKTLAASLTKIANDVRWLASGPRSGLRDPIPENEPAARSCRARSTHPVRGPDELCAQVLGNDVRSTSPAPLGTSSSMSSPVLIHNYPQSTRLWLTA